jgi:hypothetical protein
MTWAVLEESIFIAIRLAAKIVQQEVGFVIYPRNRQVIVELASVCVDRLVEAAYLTLQRSAP